jgi:putative MATE family efflux protein
MQAPEEALDLTVLYVRICGGGIIFIIFYNVIAGIFRGFGDSNTPLLFVFIACVVNIVGDLLFVAGFHMNVAGAALATVSAQAVSVLLSILIIRKKSFPFTLKKEDIRFNSEVKRFVKIGFPIAFQELLTQFSFLCLCAFINKLGLEASSGYGVAQKVTSFVMLVPGSLMQSMASFVSQNVGAGQEKRAKQAMVTGMAVGSFIGVFVFIGIYFFGGAVSSVFTVDDAVIARSWEYLRGFALEAIATAFLFSFIGYFNGHEQTFFVMIQGLTQTFLVRLPMSYVMSCRPNASLTWIGLAAPTATVAGIIINGVYFVIYTRRLKQKQKL